MHIDVYIDAMQQQIDTMYSECRGYEESLHRLIFFLSVDKDLKSFE